MSEESRTSGERFLHRMFEDISADYDFLNRLLTFGMDRRWRSRAASLCDSEDVILDLCCGTGKLLFAIKKYVGNDSTVIAIDFSPKMITLAGTGRSRPFLIADAARLPFKTKSFDCIATAFSFRNLLYKNADFESYMREVLRILREGGRFLILESSQPEREVIRRLYHLYLRLIVPFVGGLISGSRRAYKYLHLSALNHPTSEGVSARLTALGFKRVEFTPLSLGIVGIHVATR